MQSTDRNGSERVKEIGEIMATNGLAKGRFRVLNEQ
jgi:hypothetical protein